MSTELTKQQAVENQNSLLRWVLGGVAAGIIGIAGFAQLAFNTFMTRDDVNQRFLREDMKAVMSDMTTAIKSSSENTNSLVKVMEGVSVKIDGLRDDTRRGVWRSTEAPTTLPPK